MKAAVVYLIKGEPSPYLETSLKSLDRYFNNTYNYPVYIFHEECEQQDLIRSWSSSNIDFIRLNDYLKLPPYPGLSAEQVHRWSAGLDGGRKCFGLGYRQMCRFFLYNLFMHPKMANLDYYWRFDDDSFLTEEVPYDPFRLMEEQGAIYGYRAVDAENVHECHGLEQLWNQVVHYAKEQRLSRRYLNKLVANWKGKYKGFNYYNNFEINKVSFWRSHAQYQDFFHTLDKTLGFYKYRWGDANVRALSVGLFLKPSQVHHFKEIGYRHNDHYAIPGGDRVIYNKSGNPFTAN